jgi:CheY-like chemotaxis protein
MTFKTALVVDDSKLARITLKKKLEQRDLQVEMVESGQGALDYLREQKPDIIFMDHLMPDIDGFETTRRIKADPETRHIPVIMCSGKENENYLEEAQAIGASSVLSKPPENSALDAVLADIPAPEIPVSTPRVETLTAVAEEPADKPEEFSASVVPDEPGVAAQSPMDRDTVLALIREFAPDSARQREEIVADLTKTQTRILEDFSSGVDQQLEAHQQAMDQLREQITGHLAQQPDDDDVGVDELQVITLIDQRLSMQQEAAAPASAQLELLEDGLKALQGSVQTLQTAMQQREEQQSGFEQQVSARLAEQEQSLVSLIEQGVEPAQSSQHEAIDLAAVIEQASQAAIDATRQGILQTLGETLDERVPQIISDVSDQVQLQLTYQLSEINGAGGDAAAAEPQQTVDQAMGLSEAEIQERVNTVLEERLDSLESEWKSRQSVDIASIESVLDERFSGKISTAVQQALHQQGSNQPEAGAVEAGSADEDDAVSLALTDDLLDEVTRRFGQEKTQLEGRLRRTTWLLGTGMAVCLLLVLAQWFA